MPKRKLQVVMLPCPLGRPSGSTLIFLTVRLKLLIYVDLSATRAGAPTAMGVCDSRSIFCLVVCYSCL